jgi:hypothetical protein
MSIIVTAQSKKLISLLKTIPSQMAHGIDSLGLNLIVKRKYAL